MALLAMPAWAKTYKCQVNGQTAYQAKPCSNGGGEIKISNTYVREEDRLSSDNRNLMYLINKENEARLKEARRQARIKEQREQEKIAKQDAILDKIAKQDEEIKKLKKRSSDGMVHVPGHGFLPVF